MQQPTSDRSRAAYVAARAATIGLGAGMARIGLMVHLARIGLIAGLGVALVGCSGSGSGATAARDIGSVSAPPSDAGATNAPPAASGSPAAGPESQAAGSPRGSERPDPSAVEFRTDQISFEYPAGWHTRKGTPNPGGNESIVFVGPTELPSACIENAQGGACQSWPVTMLGPNGALFAWRWFGRPGLEPPLGGDPTTVGGRAATVRKGSANPECQAIGGDESIDVTVARTDGSNGWYAAEACLVGPDRTPGEAAFDAMLASAEFK
jgi:hypothetical protein